MAEILRYVDPDVVGGDGNGQGSFANAYSSLNQWEAAEQTDLDGAGNTHRVLTQASSGSNDQLECVIFTWTTSAGSYITIQGDDFPSDGIWDNTKYILENNDDTTSAIQISEDYVRIVNLQILLTNTGNRFGVYVVVVGTSDIRFDSCIVKGTMSGSPTQATGIYINDTDATVTIYNTIICGFVSGETVAMRGIVIANASNVYLYNDTVYGNYTGILRSTSGTVSVINCAVFNNTNDFSGTIATIDYCASDDGDDTGANGVTITQSADDWAALIVDAAGGDFHVTDASSELYNTGNGATPKSTFTDDIIGTTRGPADLDWDIGAFEFVSAPVGNAGIMTTNTGFWGPTF
jgi:hypothetical protein